MALPLKRNLPSLDDYEEEFIVDNFPNEREDDYEEEYDNSNSLEDSLEEKIEDDVLVQDLTDEDFINPYIEDSSPQEEIEEDSKEDDVKSNKKPLSFNFSHLKDNIKFFKKEKKEKKEKSDSELNFNPKKIIGIIAIIIILLFGIFKVLGINSSPKETKIESIVKFKFQKEEYSGIVFEINSKENKTVNIQRIYKDSNNRIILCETGAKEVYKDKEMTLFAECVNNVEDVKDTNKNLITDNITEE